MLLLLLAACTPKPPPAAFLPVAGGDPGLFGEVVTGGTLGERVIRDDADLVLIYGGEERGDLGPCGCPDRPAGGLPRAAAHVRGVRETGAPTLLVDAGAFLDDTLAFDGTLRPDVPTANRWMADGLAALEPAALHVTSVDLPGVVALGPDTGLPLVSANATAPGVTDRRVVQVGDLRVGFTGLSPVPSVLRAADGAAVVSPMRGARAALEALREEADVVVLLSWRSGGQARDLAEDGLVDVVIDAHDHSGRHPPIRVGDAVWVRSSKGTARLGELRLWLTDGRVTAARDRQIDLGPGAPEDPALAALTETAAADLDRARAAVFQPSVASP